MFNIGFEIECISTEPANKVERQLINVDPSVDVTEDGSIVTTYKHNWPVEIITAPMSAKKAIKNLKKIFSFMSDKNMKTNYSCGLHVNISHQSKRAMAKLNPEVLISATDDLYIASVYKRAANEYCYPWKHYVKMLSAEVERFNRESKSYFKLGIKDEFSKMIHQVYSDEYGLDDFPSSKISDAISAKNTSINITYLTDYRYVEYRMLGGKGYEKHIDSIEEACDHFMMGQLIAINEKGNDRVEEYLEWCSR